ncbi:hypothetical protein OG746_26685 [Streptomyces sp. NBC_01016]|uniref:hypothetical protein n=1 Tax=Streptomyces sp. NBC_01016 TaxID=2903720 RepID=UPI002250F766|nr:hypothetical protein [Streptomyces sp. NBC_01016]MCX4827183.1 hypothetical protein [Streptomyces sp. NBC_01016]MCX4832328.1 hypothetical protein [Streptomyces sp. NBC_01016]
MPKYRNNNTGDVVEYEHPDARLEMLPNWERLDTEAAPEDKGPADEQDGRPSKSANKSEWLAYARAQVQDADENDELDTLTKDQLVERYGDA